MTENTKATTALISGSMAGLVSDIFLFPIDTVKTRLQAKQGFLRSGGFRGIYRGLSSAAVGSIPTGASFFFAYETSKSFVRPKCSSDMIMHMSSACVAEAFTCTIRIPFEVVKQKAQVFKNMNSFSALSHTLQMQGIKGLYQGFVSLLFRDIPFVLIQMPLWEYLKSLTEKYTNEKITGLQSGACGSMAGGIAAALTTPFDVVKTRVILSENNSKNLFTLMITIARKEGVKRLFSGITPRITWISIGGFVFLGTYDQTRIFVEQIFLNQNSSGKS